MNDAGDNATSGTSHRISEDSGTASGKEVGHHSRKDLGKGYRALLNLYNTKRREAAKAKDDEQIQYYLRKIDEMMAISKEVTRASF